VRVGHGSRGALVARGAWIGRASERGPIDGSWIVAVGRFPMCRSPDPITWLMTGDSITRRVLHNLGYRSYTKHLHERVRGELSRFDDVVVNTGASGSTTSDLLVDLDRRVFRFHPNIVTVLLGTNDAAKSVEGRATFGKELPRSLTGSSTSARCSFYRHRRRSCLVGDRPHRDPGVRRRDR